MRILIGCERSGIVRDAFIARGHDAWSCDLVGTKGCKVRHHVTDVFNLLTPLHNWDLIILHPPCTAIAVCGNGTYSPKGIMSTAREKAIAWTRDLFYEACGVCDKVALENPVGVLSTAWRKPDQYIQPWEYGHGETKKTGLWLHNLPLLSPTNIVDGREQRVWKMGPSNSRAEDRARTYTGVATAMADQWG